MKKSYFLVFLALIIAVAGIWFYSDGQVLRRMTHALLEDFTVDKSHAATGKLYAETLRESLDEEVELQYPSMIEGMPALPAVTMKRSQLISAYKGMVFALNKVELSNIKISSVHVDGDHATVVATFSAEVDTIPDRQLPFKLELGYLKTSKNGWRVKRMVMLRSIKYQVSSIKFQVSSFKFQVGSEK